MIEYKSYELDKDERVIKLKENLAPNPAVESIFLDFKEVVSGTFTYVITIQPKGGTPRDIILKGKIPPDTGA